MMSLRNGRLVSWKGVRRATAPTTMVVTNIPAPERGREGERERGREGGREGEREREGGREGGRE